MHFHLAQLHSSHPGGSECDGVHAGSRELKGGPWGHQGGQSPPCTTHSPACRRHRTSTCRGMPSLEPLLEYSALQQLPGAKLMEPTHQYPPQGFCVGAPRCRRSSRAFRHGSPPSKHICLLDADQTPFHKMPRKHQWTPCHIHGFGP